MKYFFLLSLIATSLYAQWTPLNTSFGKQITGLHVEDNFIIASTDSNGIYVSTNSGQLWAQRNSGITNLRVFSLTKRNSLIAAGTYGAGVFTSTNNGLNWSVSVTGMTVPFIYSLFIAPNNNIFAGSGGGGGYISSNNGTNWNTNLSTTFIVNFYTITPAGYYLSSAGPTIFKSTNEGVSWTQLVTGNTTMRDIITTARPAGGFNIFVASLDGMFISTNEGVSWSTINSGLGFRNINSLASSGTNIFAGSYGGGVYLSTNNGTNWTQINTGLSNLFVKKLFINEPYIYAATENGIIWRRDLSQVITSIQEESEILNNFVLEQNYPNPFNPTTVISWQSPVGGHQTLKIYDPLGNEIATLVNEYREAGNHSVIFNAASLASGIYYFKLSTGDFIQTKKMVLIK